MAHLFWITLSKVNGNPEDLVSFLEENDFIQKIRNSNDDSKRVYLYVEVSNKGKFVAEMKRRKKEEKPIVENFVYDGLIGKAAPSSKEGRQLAAGIKKFKEAKRKRKGK